MHSVPLHNLPVFLISLSNKKKRFIKARKELSRVGLKNIIPIKAIDGDTAYSYRHSFFSINVLNNIQRGPFSTNMIPTWNAAGCALSHVSAWEQAQQHELSLIVEDDILLENTDKILFMLIEALHMHTSSVVATTTTTTEIEPNLFFFNSKRRNNALYCYDSSTMNSSSSYASLFSSSSPGSSTTTTATSSWFPESPLFLPSFARLGDSFIESADLIGSHFYLLSGTAARTMLQHVYPIEYQIDIHMTKILRKRCALQIYYSRGDVGVVQDPSYKISTVQYYSIPGAYSLYMIFDQKFPIEVCTHIFSFCKSYYEFNRL